MKMLVMLNSGGIYLDIGFTTRAKIPFEKVCGYYGLNPERVKIHPNS